MSQELITLLALVGFNLAKFISNVTKINKELSRPKARRNGEKQKYCNLWG